MPRRFYVTTPIYYANDVPHIGNAYPTIVADALRRFHALRGEETRMLTGTDEHGLKLEREATSQGLSPIAFVDKMSAQFQAAWPKLNVAPDDFIRTTESRHKTLVQELWQRIEKAGDIYLGDYEDWYCVGCESYETEKELLPGNLCPIHQKPCEKIKESTYFFRLSKYTGKLLSLYASRPGFIRPESRRNEVISFVEGGLRDLSVSRTSFSWGIPVPGDPKHVMYVWFDALANYWTALGGPNGKYADFWPPKGRVLHVVGKDILRFHAVYWPAFLLAAGFSEDELPTEIFGHGFLTLDGQKMSKSLRNSVDPLRLASELGADVVRYELLRGIAFGQDGDFDHAAMLTRYNADLGKNLGNLLNRTLGLCAKMTGSKTPAMGERTPLEDKLVHELEVQSRAAAEHWEAIEPHRALEATWALASAANQYVDHAAPWAAAAKGQPERVASILATLLEVLRALSVMIAPALPEKANELRAQLGLAKLEPLAGSDAWPGVFAPRAEGCALTPGAPLFPTYDKDQVAALLDKLVPKREAPAPAAEGAPAKPVATTPAAATAEAPTAITYDQFAATDLRIGLVVSAERVPKKDKLLKLMVDVGEATPRQIVAGLALSFKPEDLVQKRVIVVANLAPRDFGKGLVSHGMLLAAGPSEALSLASVGDSIAPGTRVK